MNYAVIQTGGKQYRVSEGDTLKIEKCAVESGQPLVFDKVLMSQADDAITLGKPYVDGYTVSAEVLEHGLGKKITGVKFKRRKNYKREFGHRQPYTLVKINKLG